MSCLTFVNHPGVMTRSSLKITNHSPSLSCGLLMGLPPRQWSCSQRTATGLYGQASLPSPFWPPLLSAQLGTGGEKEGVLILRKTILGSPGVNEAVASFPVKQTGSVSVSAPQPNWLNYVQFPFLPLISRYLQEHFFSSCSNFYFWMENTQLCLYIIQPLEYTRT